MRKDMAKVIVERPRQGHKERYQPVRHARKHDLSEDAPTKEGMKRPHVMYYGGKQLNENLNPLRRFIHSKIGHRWDDVYSEINEHLRVTSTVQAHIRQHLRDFISTKIRYDEYGQLWDMGRYYNPSLMRKGDLYVDIDGVIKSFRKQPKVKYDPGMKTYTLYRRRTSTRSMKSIYGYSYFNCEFLFADKKMVEKMGIDPKHILASFMAGTYADALKEFEKLKKQYEWHREDRIYPKAA
jgi:hypothetical protein